MPNFDLKVKMLDTHDHSRRKKSHAPQKHFESILLRILPDA
jgi:hypothetical protein